ncbi:DUF1059 domain-containing protein [Urechidicola vernalis]|uniref:DUF1059 domain-containing protein n=1 Tax=Urechidicola vernalis TaxID=3075600 RepID=A0ABU2Y633_9FLAO|nr:DUF1059 domain-containing protein [Urechidicola sp. P050]MDT0552715.1 DUF1059 domain-containing protein [Urechidicola sp. P050]
MKTMTCKQLGGSCDEEFHATTFDEIEKQSKQHGMEMLLQGDQTHLDPMHKMKNLMTSPEKIREWFNSERKEFDAL